MVQNLFRGEGFGSPLKRRRTAADSLTADGTRARPRSIGGRHKDLHHILSDISCRLRDTQDVPQYQRYLFFQNGIWVRMIDA
ncbi:hypothetical protein RB2654_22028 [Rhodobacterales bacterium HTCC2654]|uniref:Uncharacterized protein n=1 Tax=Maritimibacter alkaliphilus HTCC2654 TaxID=314271 RepID=A3VLK4_9RHOB|nr:hypothetical protein RB2654_22028 [Rhodobacterales bacterium HTCC2654] [Maritimibacter alkaliphilus HTCC2654]